MKDINSKIIIIPLIMVFIIFSFTFFFEHENHAGHDFLFHYGNANGEHISLEHSEETYFEYPPLLKSFSFLWAFREFIYFIFLMLFFGLAIPFLLYLITKNEIVVWFFFSCSSFFWLLDYYGIFAQALLAVLLLSVILIKNNYFRVFILFLSLLAHSTGFLIIGLFLLFDFFSKFDFKNLFLSACPTFIPRELNINTVAGSVKPNLFNTPINLISLNQFITCILRDYNFYYLLVSFINLPKELLLFCLSLLFIGLTNFRAYWFLSIILLIGLTSYYSNLNKKNQKLFLGFTGITFLIQIYSFIILKISYSGLC